MTTQRSHQPATGFQPVVEAFRIASEAYRQQFLPLFHDRWVPSSDEVRTAERCLQICRALNEQNPGMVEEIMLTMLDNIPGRRK